MPKGSTFQLTGSRKRDVARWTNVRGPIYYNSPTSPNGEEVEVVHPSIGHQSSASPSQPSYKIFQRHIIPSTPRNFQPILSTIPSSIPPPSPNPSTARPSLASPLKPSPIPHPRKSPMVTSHQLQPVASSSRRREERSPFPFHATKVLQRR
ncbi:hypothetical protein O181_052331 [Austropuccinia psidii MF-1]|uniref:Uncharacterized protein n=1 Tax=Austropuccinia psidii MF-1 TaxID=1389203 RepID=A0A9Q3E5D8_9BASI|nr:hypothetical protein [Austropuccinia psidii MF-1]